MPRNLLRIFLIVLTLSAGACSTYRGPIDNSPDREANNGLPGHAGYFAP